MDIDYTATVDKRFIGLDQAALFDDKLDCGNGVSAQEVVMEICRQSAEGFGVTHVTKAMGLPQDAALNWLQKYHGKEIQEAKKVQLRRKDTGDVDVLVRG
jgi:hypothetical protein